MKYWINDCHGRRMSLVEGDPAEIPELEGAGSFAVRQVQKTAADSFWRIDETTTGTAVVDGPTLEEAMIAFRKLAIEKGAEAFKAQIESKLRGKSA